VALFDRCAECRRCCHIDPGEPPLEITLTAEESGQFGHVCLERECRFLGATGCVLGDAKPFSCQLYPLAYKPRNRGFYYDVECPLMNDYVAQLADPQSEASAHLGRMSERIRELEKSDAEFLDRNFAVDKRYFRLRRLASTTASVKTWLSWNFWFSR
jgi:Fe-S-cluster containining protein